MLAQFLQCMRNTTHDVTASCVQGVLDTVGVCVVLVGVRGVHVLEYATGCSHSIINHTLAPHANNKVSLQDDQNTFPAVLRTPGALLHAARHVLDWVLDNYMDVLFCQGIEVRWLVCWYCLVWCCVCCVGW